LYLGVVAVFVSSEVLAAVLGIRFAVETLGALYQYLDPHILRHDLLRGIYHLHAQPPLFNLFLGVVLKVFPEAYPLAFSAAFGAMGLGVLLGTARLMRLVGVSPGMSLFLTALLAWFPSFMVYRHLLFYTLPVALGLVAGALLLSLYVRRPRSGIAHAFAWCAALVMLTRATYHPLWYVALLVSVAPFLEKRARRVLLLASVAPLIAVNGWYLKTLAQVGVYGGSSWVGINLTKRWPLAQNEVAALKEAGVLPPAWQRRPFQEPAVLQPLGYFEDRGSVHPAICAPYKSNGEPNFNHRDYARLSRDLLAANLTLIWRHPGRYLRRVGTALLLFLQPGPNSVHFLVEYDFSRVFRVRDALTRFVFLGGQVERPIRIGDPPANLWLALFPMVVVFGVWRVVKTGSAAERPVLAYILVTVLWLTLATSLIEIGENDRMRWEAEPLILVLLASFLRSGREAVRGALGGAPLPRATTRASG
jgi:hypothetical protein